MNSFGDLNKDQRLRLGSYAMLNMDEMEAMTKREMNVIKSVITTKVITERRAFRWDDESFVRLASFCGSTNSRQFLNDPTGTRRWLPFEVERIQDPHNRDAGFEDIIYRGMYAQAKYLIENHYQYWFDEDEIAELEEHNDEYRLQGTEEELLPLLFTVPADSKGVFMPNEEIKTTLVDTFNLKTQVSTERVSGIMSRMGFTKACHRINGIKTRGWYVHKLNADEMVALKRTLR
jgi:predicted P-loop ATPase